MSCGNKSSVKPYNFINGMIYSVKNKGDLKAFDDLIDLQSKIKHVEKKEKLSRRQFHCGTKKLSKLITKASLNLSGK